MSLRGAVKEFALRIRLLFATTEEGKDMEKRRWYPALFLVLSIFGYSATAGAGPVILGGDDLTDHGSFNGTANISGWLYIQKAIDNILNTPGNITRPGNNGSIAALGAASVGGCPPACPGGNAGGA